MCQQRARLDWVASGPLACSSPLLPLVVVGRHFTEQPHAETGRETWGRGWVVPPAAQPRDLAAVVATVPYTNAVPVHSCLPLPKLFAWILKINRGQGMESCKGIEVCS